MFSISLLFYESGIYGLKWLEIVQMYGEKAVTCYDPLPQGNPELGGHHPPPPPLQMTPSPNSILKSWQVCAFSTTKR